MLGRRSGEFLDTHTVAIFRLDGVTQITNLNLPSSAPTYPMSIRARNFTDGELLVAEFWKKGKDTKRLFYKEVNYEELENVS